ncbi:hypothetical protein LHYA1_G000907, partial [Lachnellula hyalina]
SSRSASRDHPDLWKADDDWTKVTEKEERKRIQNRLSQRTYRRKHAKQDIKKCAFRVERFRVSDIPIRESSTTLEGNQTGKVNRAAGPELHDSQILLEGQLAPSSPYLRPNNTPIENLFLYSSQETRSPGWSFSNISSGDWGRIITSGVSPSTRYVPLSTYFPLSSDHLLRLIHLNVYRAITELKEALKSNAVIYKKNPVKVMPQQINLCDSYTIILPRTDKPLPIALQPTEVQMNISHSAWFNVFPFPNSRDNLIRYEAEFDHLDLCNDLFGDLIGNNNLLFSRRLQDFTLSSALEMRKCDISAEFDDEITANRNGLIVWGEPCDPESWEATPGFLMKWFRLLGGCRGLITSSNRWRAKRFEEPLSMPSYIDITPFPAKEDVPLPDMA